MNKQTLNSFRSAGNQQLTSAGAANGVGNRARTFRTKAEKFNDPKRQRKQDRDYMRFN